ncbi:MAG TPA: nucleotidyl transferase AbiEii/AbiGii toxin family protein [Aeromicrobium sp.]|nr:nucleotidyl transferase AbiEii/AbiGii toxin family protein [Aeromicrobium sp.]
MAYPTPPPNLKSLEQRIRNLEPDDGLALQRQITMAMVVVSQMLPEGAIKGGMAMALRYGRAESRFTRDVDAARIKPIDEFCDNFEAALRVGWGGFAGRLVQRRAPRPSAVPSAYVMRPFDVKLDYQSRPWRTVTFELGHNEVDDAAGAELRLAPDLVELFTEVGLPVPRAVPVMRADHQIAQKLHAASAPSSDRARDLVDLQLLDKGEQLDLAQVRLTCERLFNYRKQQSWPPTIVPDVEWDALYAAAARDLTVLADVDSAVDWGNDFIARIAMSAT